MTEPPQDARPEWRCATCKHWVSVCSHGAPIGNVCTQCHSINRPASQSPLVTANEAGAKGHCQRSDMGNGGEPADESSLMWGQDGSDYEAFCYTRPNFGCVMWEKRDG